MRRIYLEEAVEARPIITRLLENTKDATDLLIDLHNGEDKVTVKQFRQGIDQLVVEAGKLKERLLAAEVQLQVEAEK